MMASALTARGPAPREFHSLAWRLEVPVASRTSADASGAGPTVELQLNLAAATAGRASGGCEGSQAAAAASSEAGEGGANSSSAIETEYIRLDYAGLVELAAAVDAAVAAVDDRSYRAIHRSVK
jgi:hypothetical protein